MLTMFVACKSMQHINILHELKIILCHRISKTEWPLKLYSLMAPGVGEGEPGKINFKY